jgi:hypothetical protein
MAAPKYLERDLTSGKVAEVIATETGPAPEQIVSTGPGGLIDPSLLPSISTSGHFVQAEVDFGTDGTTATTTVIGQTWVTPVSIILCNPFGGATPDHGPEDALAEGLVAFASNLVPGVGFDIQVYAPQNTWGRYLINATGQ